MNDTQTIPEPILDDLDVRDDAPDGLALVVERTLQDRPDFRDLWEPIVLVGQIERERVRLGLSQADVAERMGVARTAVVKLENDPTGVAFGRIMAYARAVGVELHPEPSKQKPAAPPPGRGRKVLAPDSSRKRPSKTPPLLKPSKASP